MPSPAARPMAIVEIAVRGQFHLQLLPRRLLANDGRGLARTFARHHRHSPSSSRSSGAPQLPQMSTDPLTNAS